MPIMTMTDSNTDSNSTMVDPLITGPSQRAIRFGNRSAIAAAVLGLWCFATLFIGGSIASTMLSVMQTSKRASAATTPVDAKIDDRLVIIARYNEDVSWAPLFLGNRIPYEVCQKGDPLRALHPSMPLPDFYITPNRGQEALCYISAIIKYYHNLPDQMAFVHGHRTAWHERDNALKLLSYQWEKRLPYASLSTVEADDNGRSIFPNGAQVCLDPKDCSNRDIRDQGRYTAMAFDELFSDLWNMTKPGTIRTMCCAQFVVTKETILEHPLETYEAMLRWLVQTEMEDYWTSRVFEYVWHILFGMPAYYRDPPTCERFHCDDKGRMIVPTSGNNHNNYNYTVS